MGRAYSRVETVGCCLEKERMEAGRQMTNVCSYSSSPRRDVLCGWCGVIMSGTTPGKMIRAWRSMSVFCQCLLSGDTLDIAAFSLCSILLRFCSLCNCPPIYIFIPSPKLPIDLVPCLQLTFYHLHLVISLHFLVNTSKPNSSFWSLNQICIPESLTSALGSPTSIRY